MESEQKPIKESLIKKYLYNEMTKEYTEGKAQKCEAFGEQFDSLLEKRYAHFFQLMGWTWTRPKEGFLVSGKQNLSWLPDFRIEMSDGTVFWVEVKPNGEFVNFAKFVRAIFQDKNVAVCLGQASANVTIARKTTKSFYSFFPDNYETLWEEAGLAI